MKFFGKKLLTLLAVSIAFALLGYLLLYGSLQSIIQPVTALWGMFSSHNTDIGESSDETSYIDLYEQAKKDKQESSEEGNESNPGEISLIDESDDTSEETVKSSSIQFPLNGYKFAELSIDGTSIQNVSLFFGDGKKVLKLGVGMYIGSSFPGMGSTCLISGHNNRDFHALKDVEIGMLIRVSTGYGEYTYRVTACELHKNTDSSAYDLGAENENIILYTCYPFDELGVTSMRYFVYGEYVSGPRILLNE